MPPLKNIKHEKFAKALLTQPSQTAAYALTYKSKDIDSAGANASRLLGKDRGIRERVQELLDKQGLTLERFNNKMSDLLEAKSEDVQFKSMRLGYELHGVLDKEKYDDSAKDILIQVNIIGRNGEETSVTI